MAVAVPGKDLDPQARSQIEILQEAKRGRTPAQRKLDSQLIYALRQRNQGAAVAGIASLKPALQFEPDGRVLVDIDAEVVPGLLSLISQNGGVVVNSFQRYHAVRALVPLALVDLLSMRPEVHAIRPADRAITNASLVDPEGDVAHRADQARSAFQADGSGVKVGVLSDSADYLTNVQATGDLPAVTVLSGQAGMGSGEGTAMLEIVHSLAPGANLYFATAFNGVASFAQNIRSLQAAGCNIIVDDVLYFNESPFQDGPIARAVDDVTAAGAMYFSSAGNYGALDRNTAGTWEGDFKDGGPATIGRGGRVHDFGGGTNYDTVMSGPGAYNRVDLFWSDPLGAATNDYDVYVLNSSNAVVRASTNTQNGHGDPYESISSLNPGERIVIVKYSGADRYLYLTTVSGRLAIATAGSTRGHNSCGATNAFCIAAARVPVPLVPFVGGSTNPVEYFSCDGPRRIFYNPDGSAITPGDFSAAGGRLLQKPDLTAADGVSTTVPGFASFYGTSAAAPHAAAIAALVWSFNPFLLPGEVGSILTSTALDAAGPGWDRDAGAGIVMAYPGSPGDALGSHS